jgi:hypothetical protein
MFRSRASRLVPVFVLFVLGITLGLFACGGGGGGQGATPPVGVFPLRVEANKRYLIDAKGNPFLLQGDAGWELIAKLTSEEAEQYLEDRRLKGFNAVIVRLIDHNFLDNPPKNASGDLPFLKRLDNTTWDGSLAYGNINTEGPDFSTPNESYFTHADWVLNKAREKGILVLLAPAYTGFQGGGEGWYQEMQANGVAKLRAYGQFLGNRYKDFTNILWIDGGDFSPPDESGKDLVRAVANGIRDRDVDTRALHSFHGGRFTAALDFWGPSEPWLTVNDIYTDEDTVVSMALVEYTRSPMPFFLIENRYENEGVGDARLVRTQAFQAMLSGATGHVMGNFPVWGFFSDWQSALNSDGARTLQHLRRLLEARAWWTLQPDSGALLTSGINSGADRAAAARAADGSFAIAYVPSVRPITIGLSQLSGPRVQARWCDPDNGTCATVSGSPFAATGSLGLLPVGNNSGGFGDWVLVLESTQ